GSAIRHRGWVNAIALSPDGRAILTGSDDTTARLWTVPDGVPRTPPLRHLRPVKAVAISPDGRLLLTASEDSSAQFWDAGLGHPVGKPFRALAPLSAARFSPAGRTLLTGDRSGRVRLWRTPFPVGGDVERIRLWIQQMAGAELDDTGALKLLDAATWNQR